MSDEELQQVNGADIAGLDISDHEAVMEVRDTFGNVLRHADGRPFTVTLYSRDSSQFLDTSRRQQDIRLQQTLRTRIPTAAAVADKDAIELLVAVTKSWDIILNGKPAETTPESYRAVYTKYRRLREQVDEFLGNPANFTQG